MPELTDVTVVADSFEVGGAAQALLDRFLIGYPRSGSFVRPRGRKVRLCLVKGRGAEVARRQKDFSLEVLTDVERAAAGADSLVLAPNAGTPRGERKLVRTAFRSAREGARVFVHGELGDSRAEAEELAASSARRKLRVVSGSYMGTTWRLPDVDSPRDAALREALIVTFGQPDESFLALDGLLPFIERRRSGESGVKSVIFHQGRGVWEAGLKARWSEELLAAAISRTDTPQGDALEDARTQDLMGLGLVPKLARDPRVYVIEHVDGLRSTLMSLEGVIADTNLAVRTVEGKTISTQIYHPPGPGHQQWSCLAGRLDDFFAGGPAPWPLERGVFTAALLEAMRKASAKPGVAVDGPMLAYENDRPSVFERA